jgi:hypothetical protein
VIPKNLALLLPDWNSLDSVRNAHSRLELWAIWLFAALVVCDVIAHLIEDNHKPIAKTFERIGLFCFAFAVAAELGAYKYGQRNDELSEGVISSLGTKAQTAFDKASEADKLSKSASDLAGPAKTAADEAKRQTEAVGVQANDLTRQMSAATTELANAETAERKEEEALVNLSTCLTPRVIPQWKVIKGSTERSLVDPLKPFAETNVVIEYVPDFEARRAAFSLLNVLQAAGWKVTSISPGTTLNDGVYIEPHRLSSPTGSVTDGSKAEDAADGLVAFLRSFNWQADKWLPSAPSSIPAGTLKILVGLYPPVVSIRAPGTLPLMDDWVKLGKQIESNFDEQEKLHPEQRESLEKEKNTELEPWRSPCHSLTYDFSSNTP